MTELLERALEVAPRGGDLRLACQLVACAAGAGPTDPEDGAGG